MFKGVLRHYKTPKHILIKIVDIYGNIVTFTPSDIPDIIEQLKASIDFDNIDFTFVVRKGSVDKIDKMS